MIGWAGLAKPGGEGSGPKGDLLAHQFEISGPGAGKGGYRAAHHDGSASPFWHRPRRRTPGRFEVVAAFGVATSMASPWFPIGLIEDI